MAKLLVHVTCGPEQPTKAAPALLSARAAIDEGHEVSVSSPEMGCSCCAT
jgi:hypothetical protein